MKKALLVGFVYVKVMMKEHKLFIRLVRLSADLKQTY